MTNLDHGVSVIRAHARTAPQAPGVYRMIDRHGDVLYVGKAKNLSRRVPAYTRVNQLPTRLLRLVSATVEMDFITTRTEAEALLREATLIKRFKPPFNVLLKDDKSFPYILLRDDHPWPQITKHRGARKGKGHYYGPFANTSAVNNTLNTLQKVFQLRSCTDATLENRSRPCLLYQIKRCSAPCVGRVDATTYANEVADARAFLEGRTTAIQKTFAEKMQAASDALDFETAALYRDRLKALTQIQSHQTYTDGQPDDGDVIAAARAGDRVAIQIVFFRAGQNWGHRAFFPRHAPETPLAEVLTAFIGQFYDNKPAPRRIMLSHDPAEKPLLAEALSARMDHKVTLSRPARGAKARVVAEAVRNAEQALERKLAESASQKQLLAAVQDAFDLPAPPRRIEVYDNSHTRGNEAIGAMVVAGPDGFEKKAYRTFNIKDETLSPGDDYGMMREVMTRRFKRLVKEDGDRSRGHWPDLVLIDGGRGQLSAVVETLNGLGVADVALVAVSKGPDRHAGREQFHMPGRASFTLPPNAPVMHYLQRLRDEAHRFAIGTHRAKRGKARTRSGLDDVPGIGPKRKKALLHHFGSAKAVAGADLGDLQAVDGISRAMAQEIFDFFRD
ncbi:excinuclease ABC subunit UvrC [Yunchengibacter salinarum]|uniref:excinuclease ABC subunit UvrC n=1 Tax=Yunchengibacter salinarum TaxID=3133399 RepID=UPI0035B640CC